MTLTCVLFCLENNSYISSDFYDDKKHFSGKVNYVKDYKDALHFANRDRAIEFIYNEGWRIKDKSGMEHFTPREYYKIDETEILRNGGRGSVNVNN